MIDLWMYQWYESSIREESDESVSDIGEHFIELLLSVEFLILSESGVVISDVFPDFLIESVSQWWNGDNGNEGTGDDIRQFNHYFNIDTYFLSAYGN